MIIRVFLEKNTFYDVGDPDQRQWDGFAIEGCYYGSGRTKIGVVKAIYNNIKKWSLSDKAQAVGCADKNSDYKLFSPNKAYLKIYNNSKPWKTFRYGRFIFKVRVFKR